jgi:hypothetical protein
MKEKINEHRERAAQSLDDISYWMRNSSISYTERDLKRVFKEVIHDYMKSV